MQATRAAKVALAVLLSCLCLPGVAAAVEYVIHISVDGLRPDAITNLGSANLPNFYRFRTEGAFTDNARTDYDYTVTLPNHATQLTGRGVVGPNGHNWTSNGDPGAATLASNKGSYVAGVFDVAHDSGLQTALYATKTKFSLFDQSWNGTNGASDMVGVNNGQDKIDKYSYYTNSNVAVTDFLADMALASPSFNYAFLHFYEPDSVGHSSSWDPAPGSDYSDVIITLDAILGNIFNLIETTAALDGNTAVILTADHGGSGYDHGDPALAADYTIPFCVWGPGVPAGADLYSLNPGSLLDPGLGRPPYSDLFQPLRNGAAANLSLALLGLDPVPGSTIDAPNVFAFAVPEPSTLAMLLGLGGIGMLGYLRRRRRS